MLFSDWVIQILAFLITGAVYVGVFHFGANLGSLILSVADNEKAYRLFVSVFLVLAGALFAVLVVGLVNFEVNAVKNGKGNIADIFEPFSSSSELSRAYGVFFHVLVRVLVFLLPGLLVLAFTEYYYYDGFFWYSFSVFGYDAVYFLLKAVSLLLFYMGFVRTASMFPGIYITYLRKDLDVSDCFFIAKVCMGKEKNEMAHLALSFLPLAVLSLFTVGLLPVMYTLPYVTISFVMYSKYIYDKEMYTKNTAVLMYSDKESE